jgi:histidine ammonia-lyase
MPSYSSIVATDADQSISVSNTAATLTLPAEFASTGGSHSGRVTVQVRTAAILYTINGTAPTAADESTGIKLNVGDILILTTLAAMRNLKMIRASGTDGAVFVQYEKRVN